MPEGSRVPTGIPEYLIPEGETVLRVAHPTRIVLAPLIIITVLVTVLAISFWYTTGDPIPLYLGFLIDTVLFVFIARRVLILATSEYVLTDRRLVKQTGIFSKASVDSWLDKVNNVEHRQSLWGRILGFGDVIVDTASETGTTVFPAIASPLSFKRAITDAAQRYRESMNRGAPAAAGPLTASQRLRELKSLLDEGLLSATEYEESRRRIITEL